MSLLRLASVLRRRRAVSVPPAIATDPAAPMILLSLTILLRSVFSLTNALLKKGVISEREVQAAEREFRAGLAVEQALIGEQPITPALVHQLTQVWLKISEDGRD